MDQINHEAKSRAFRAANELEMRRLMSCVAKGLVAFIKAFFRSTYTASAPGTASTKWKPALELETKDRIGNSGRRPGGKACDYPDVNMPILKRLTARFRSKETEAGSTKTISYHLTIKPRPFEEPIIEAQSQRLNRLQRAIS